MDKKLEKYNQKRDFNKTSEPKGKAQNYFAKKKLAANTLTKKSSGKSALTKNPAPESPLKSLPKESSVKKLRFVVQHHAASRNHFDFRLQWDGVLLSWAVPKGPSFNSSDKRLAVKVEDHPLEYRNFEGNIPKGEYGGGVVMLWDEGFYEPLNDFENGLTGGSLKFVLHGKRLRGKWALVKINSAKSSKADNWLLIKENDGFSSTEAGIFLFDTSVRTGRTMDEIKNGQAEKKEKRINEETEDYQTKKEGRNRKAAGNFRMAKEGRNTKVAGSANLDKDVKNPFSSAPVMLAKSETVVPKSGNWIYELKYDGYRILAYIESGNVRLVSRNGIDYTRQFKDVADKLKDWAGGSAMVLDGEMVIIGKDGKTDFGALQKYIKNSNGNPTYIVFDLLALNGKDFRAKPLLNRKERLQEIMTNAPSNLYFSKHIEERGEESFRAACEKGLEGIIGKKADSVYSGTRNGDWIKLKCDNRQEFIICGYTMSEKKLNSIGSLLLGYYNNGELIYAGRVGSGFTESLAKELLQKFDKIKTKTPPFKNPPKKKETEKIIWLSPKIAAEVKFSEWTKDNLLRHPSFKGLREDKSINEIVKEKENAINNKSELKTAQKKKKSSAAKAVDDSLKPDNFYLKDNKDNSDFSLAEIISNPQKLMFNNPKITKIEVAEYYKAVSGRMLPYIQKRILSLICCPNGIYGSCFFKKHNLAGGKITGGGKKADNAANISYAANGVVAVNVINGKGENEEYFYIDNVFGLINQVQNNTIEFHTWASTADNLEKPDIMIFDLDPDKGMDLNQVRLGVKDLKSILDSLSLTSYLKTSGGKGYHIVIPFKVFDGRKTGLVKTGHDKKILSIKTLAEKESLPVKIMTDKTSPLKTLEGWEAFRLFAKNVAEVMEQKWPDRYTSNVRKEKRKGKIFIDWIRNTKGATSIAPYSIRARDGASISMPIEWDELDKIAPDGINMAEAIKRLARKDPWSDFLL